MNFPVPCFPSKFLAKKKKSETSCIIIIRWLCQVSLASVWLWTNLEPLEIFWAISAWTVFKSHVYCFSVFLFFIGKQIENDYKICSLYFINPSKESSLQKWWPCPAYSSLVFGKFNKVLPWHVDFHLLWEKNRPLGKLSNGNNGWSPGDIKERLQGETSTLPAPLLPMTQNEPVIDWYWRAWSLHVRETQEHQAGSEDWRGTHMHSESS